MAGSRLLFRFVVVVVVAAYERRSLAIASNWLFEEWGRFLPDHRIAVSLLDCLLHHNNVVATDGGSYRMREARSRTAGRPTSRSPITRGGDFRWPPAGTATWPLTPDRSRGGMMCR